jgi:hypothetical protein
MEVVVAKKVQKRPISKTNARITGDDPPPLTDTRMLQFFMMALVINAKESVVSTNGFNGELLNNAYKAARYALFEMPREIAAQEQKQTRRNTH